MLIRFSNDDNLALECGELSRVSFFCGFSDRWELHIDGCRCLVYETAGVDVAVTFVRGDCYVNAYWKHRRGMFAAPRPVIPSTATPYLVR